MTYYPVAGAMRINSTLYYILKDHLGSASVVTDASGNILGEQRYYPFGETRSSTGSTLTDKLFNGQREMAGLGIYHYQARFYSPKLGRFLSADSIVPNFDNPQDLNRYTYVKNSPINYTDPSGRCYLSGHWIPDSDAACQWASNNQDSLSGSGNGGFVSNGGPSEGGGGGDENEEETSSLSEILNDLLNLLDIGIIGFPVVIQSEWSDSNDIGTDLAIWKPKPRGDDATWNALARRLGIDVRTLRGNVESCKEPAGVPPDGDVEIDDEMGDIYYRGEHIGNAKDGC